MKLLAYTISQQSKSVILKCSDGKSLTTDNFNDACGFLLGHCDFAIVWDVDKLAELLSSMLPKETGEQLLDGGRIYCGEPTRKLYYQQNRLLGINYINFYSLKRYADEPITDCTKLLDLAYKIIKAFQTLGIPEVTKLTSPIAVWAERLNTLPFPRSGDLPETAFPLTDACSKVMTREWRDTYTLGHWNDNEVTDLDMHCYSDDTEVLTFDGWKLIKDLREGELIMGFNPNKKTCSFQPVKTLNSYRYNGEMIHIKNTKIDLLITPNHRVLYRSKLRDKKTLDNKPKGHDCYSDWIISPADKLPNGNICLPISFPIEDKPDYPISDSCLSLIAWVITEGWLQHDGNKAFGIYIEQSFVNSDYCNEISNILSSLNIPFTDTVRTKPYKHEIPIVKDRIIIERSILQYRHIYHITAKHVRKLPLYTKNIHNIPLWLLQVCSIRQLRLFYDCLMKGDGSRAYNHSGKLVKATFTTNLEPNKDKMQYLCHLLGYKVNAAEPNKSHTTYQLFITETKDDTFNNETGFNFGYLKRPNEQYDGIVYCPTIEDGFLVVRRNGRSCISGNSAYPSIVAKLPDITNATFFSSDTMPDKYSWGELYGVLKITKPVSPFYCEKVDGYPIGEWEDSITTDQLWLLNKYQIGSFEMTHGDFFLLPEKYALPFKDTMETLYKARSQSDLMSLIAKGISVGIWGKFAERYEERLGDHFNSIYARMTTSRCIVKVADNIYRNNLSPISVTVDGILVEGKHELPNQKIMGTWRSEPPSPALVASQLYQWLNGKKPAMLKYPEIMAMIKEKPNASVYKDVDLNLLQHSRNFSKLPKTGGNLINNKYRSEPLKV